MFINKFDKADVSDRIVCICLSIEQNITVI